MSHSKLEDDTVLPENVLPIRDEMMFVFDQNTPIVDPAVQERVENRRYEAGMCRDCDSPRGYLTSFCRVHYPHSIQEWREQTK